MAKYIVFNDIDHVIGMIHEQSRLIQAYEGKIPQIEIDILMSNVRRLYEDLMELNKLNQQFRPEPRQEQDPLSSDDTEARELVTIVADPEPETQPPAEERTPAINLIPEKEEPAPDLHVQAVEPPPVEEPRSEPVMKVEPPLKKSGKKSATADLFAQTESNTLADKFKNNAQSYNDRISHDKKDKTLADTLLKPIADLRTGIGVNDRFVFINELFSGSMSDYQTAIDEINRQENIESASRILDELKSVLQWKDTSDGLKRLRVFVSRRFA